MYIPRISPATEFLRSSKEMSLIGYCNVEMIAHKKSLQMTARSLSHKFMICYQHHWRSWFRFSLSWHFIFNNIADIQPHCVKQLSNAIIFQNEWRYENANPWNAFQKSCQISDIRSFNHLEETQAEQLTEIKFEGSFLVAKVDLKWCKP